MTPLISVIVPIYNVEKFLPRSVDSILSQTYKNLEIILVDDGSTDSSAQICDDYAAKDFRVKVIHQKNAGVAIARNVGVAAATGDYIYFVDSDDYVESNLCERMIDLFSREQVDIIVFDYYYVNDKGDLSSSPEKLSERIVSQKDALCELMGGNINSYLWNKMYKRKVFEGISFPEGRVWEDMATGHKIFLNAESLYFLPEKLYYYYMRKGSIIHSISQKALCDIFNARYTSYMELRKEHSYAAELVFSKVALTAIRLYDRTLWEEAYSEDCTKAISFLAENKEKILGLENNKLYRFYYNHPKLYRFFRVAKHKFGNIVKAINRKFRLF